jgi:glycosyltransferase involved in cell wall biosynthesis
MVCFSFVSTIYNNINQVRACVDSILSAMDGLDFEVVIVDNFSSDGSFEVLQEYAHLHSNIRVLRCKCSRGLGRQIAFENSRGSFVVYIDMDTVYDSRKLRKFLLAYLRSDLRQFAVKTWGSFCVYPRCLVDEVGGWKSFNVAEDSDLLARLFSIDKIFFMPIRLDFNEEYVKRKKPSFLAKQLMIVPRENRYANGIKLILRMLRNKVDHYAADSYTIKKLIVWHRFLRKKSQLTFFVCLQVAASKIVTALMGKRNFANPDPYLLNAHFVSYRGVKDFVDPEKFGFEIEPIIETQHRKYYQYISYVKPDINKKLKLLL